MKTEMCHTFYHKLQSKLLCKSLVPNKQNQIVMTSAVVDCAVTMLQQVVSQYVLYYLLGMRRHPPTKETVEKSGDVIKSTPVKTKRKYDSVNSFRIALYNSMAKLNISRASER